MRSYSLVSVLAAMIVLMGALVPLITLQGRFFENVSKWDNRQRLIDIEEHYQILNLKPEDHKPLEKSPAYNLKPMGDGLIRVTFQTDQGPIHAFVFQAEGPPE